MTPSLRRTAQLLAVLVAAVLLGGSVGLTSAAAQAAQVTVTLTEGGGASPEFIEVPVGGTVVFVNDDSSARQITATTEEGKSTPWEYDSGVLAPRDGDNRATSAPTPAFEQAGRYTFSDTRGLLLPTTRADEIGVLPPPSPAPSGGPSSGPAPSGEPGAAPGGSASPGADGSPAAGDSASPGAPAATGGTGTTAPLPLDGGFSGTGTAPVPIPGDPLAPAIAPPLLLPDVGPAPLPYIAAPLDNESPSVAALPTGSLPGADTGRENGLPAVLAGLAIVGLVSMLVRVLLAEPAARRSPEVARGLRPVVVTG